MCAAKDIYAQIAPLLARVHVCQRTKQRVLP